MGTKGPRTPGWNLKTNALKSQADLPAGYGIGLAHAYSGTMALDIDNWVVTTTILSERGIDLQALYDAPDAVVINSGRPGHGKLLYAMPFGLALPSKKILHHGITAYELRCATAGGLTVQDVLPPSIHPETMQPYRWAGRGNWVRLPTIPEALLDLWNGMLDQDKARTIATDGTMDASWEEIRQALECIPADCSRDEWISIGMALHWAGTQTTQLDQALQLWNEWSSTAQTKYPGEAAIMGQWASFRPDKATSVKLGTLFHIAKRHGWHRPLPDVSAYFAAVEQSHPKDISSTFRPAPPELDMGLFPPLLTGMAMEISQAMGSDPLVSLWTGVAAVMGAVDARSRLELLPGYKVPPILWIMNIGNPAEKKSPASDPVLQIFEHLRAEAYPQFKRDMLEWECKEAAYSSAKKALLEFAASPEGLLDGGTGHLNGPAVPDLPQPPVEPRIVVKDITSQKMVRMVAERPMGLLCHLDEMASWIHKMNDNRSGEDRSAWVQAYEGKPYIMDRVGAGSIHCENFAVSIIGNIQPKVFRENLRKMATDGLLQRFVPVILRKRRWTRGVFVPEYLSCRSAWENTIRVAHALPTMVFKLSDDARAVFQAFQDWYDAQKQDEYLLDSDEVFMQSFGKLEGTTGRLIFAFHLVESPFNPIVGADTVRRVVELVKSYVVPSFRYALGEVAGEGTFDTWLTDHIIQHCDAGLITMSEIRRSGRRQLANVTPWQAEQMILTGMHTLEKANWVVRVDDGSREHQHIAQWAIDAGLAIKFKAHRMAVIAAKQRQMEHIYKLSPKEKPRVHGYAPDEE